jgi:glycosyltransferase involved in cell wall biosynthesis
VSDRSTLRWIGGRLAARVRSLLRVPLEALASGTPAVVSAQSALPEVVGAAGAVADGEGPAFAAAVREPLARPERDRRMAARRRAELYPWSAAVEGFLAAHAAGYRTVTGTPTRLEPTDCTPLQGAPVPVPGTRTRSE